MRNIRYDADSGLDLPREIQLRRMLRVMEQELTPLQRRTLAMYYFQELSPTEISRIRGVHRSTVVRTIARAERRMRRCLNY